MGTNYINTPYLGRHMCSFTWPWIIFKLSDTFNLKRAKNFKSDFKIYLSFTCTCASAVKRHFVM